MFRFFSLITPVILSLLTHPLASPSDFEKKVADFWAADAHHKRVLGKVSGWAEKYHTDKVISAASSEEIQELIEQIYSLRQAVRGLNQLALPLHTRILKMNRFLSLYAEPESSAQTRLILQSIQLDKNELLSLLLSTLADLVMYEQVSFLYHLSHQDGTLIRRLNEIIVVGKRDHFDRLQEAWLSVYKRKEFNRSLALLDNHKAALDRMEKEGYLFLKTLRSRLETHMVEELRKSQGFWGRIGQYFKSAYERLKNGSRKKMAWMEYHLSKIFGNIVGSVNYQRLLKSVSKTELEYLVSEVLQPGDIIVEKTRGAITDNLIPGHYGHLALFIGSPEQIKAIELKDGSFLIKHPVMQAHLTQLKEGKTLVEALRPGTWLNDLKNWTVSDIAVLRPESYPKEYLGHVLLEAIQYANTAYDFRFDVNTISTAVCSEIPFHSYKGLNFRVYQRAGRFTISPDDVAVLSGPPGQNLENRPLQLIYMNEKTKRLSREQMFPHFLKSLGGAGSDYDRIPENDHSYPGLESSWTEFLRSQGKSRF
jgi:hypothetical protein